MLREEDIAIELRSQQFLCKYYMRDLSEERSVLLFESEQQTKDVICPHCQGNVYTGGYGSITHLRALLHVASCRIRPSLREAQQELLVLRVVPTADAIIKIPITLRIEVISLQIYPNRRINTA